MGNPGEIPVGPFQDRVIFLLGQGHTLQELASRCGYIRFYMDRRGPGNPYDRVGGDNTTFRRRLGFTENGGARGSAQTHMTYETAVRIADGLWMDPVEAGI